MVSQALRSLVLRLVGDDDPSIAVERLDGAGLDAASLILACRTVPFLASRRVVVVREAGSLARDVVDALVEYLGDPVPWSCVVLVPGGGALSPRLQSKLRSLGGILDVDLGSAKARSQWLAERLKSAPVRLDAKATELVSAHLGEEVGRAESLLESLGATYGQGARLGVEDVAPFLGEAGTIPPWELIDAIDGGDEAGSLAALRRLSEAGARHPLVVLSVLHRHYEGPLRLDGSGANSEAEAAQILGGSSFVAGKALRLARRLGHDGIARAICLLAEADLDLRGATALPAAAVLEVLVARLARMSKSTVARRRPSTSGNGRGR